MLPILIISAACGQLTFRGTWNVSVNGTRGFLNESARFQLLLDETKPVENLNYVSAIISLQNSSRIKFQSSRYGFHGISYNKSTSFFFFSLSSYTIFTENNSLLILNETINYNNLTDPYDPYQLHQLLCQRFTNVSLIPIYSLFFNLTSSNKIKKGFELDPDINGSLISDSTIFHLNGSLLDIYGYIIEGKKFGVLASLGVLLTFFAWYSLTRNFNTTVKLAQLSIHSFILHIGFDFSYALFLLDLSVANSHFTSLFTFLFVSMISIYFVFQMRELASIWKAHNEAAFDEDNRDVRILFFRFFGEVALLMCLSSVAMSSVFDTPILSLLFLSSSSLPQIIHSVKGIQKKKGDGVFMIFISLARLIPLWYFCVYYPNIYDSHSSITAILTSLWVCIQVFIILLQNKFGGGFFLPKSMKPAVFDYHATRPPPGSDCPICMLPIEEEEDSVVTPCGHSFHYECLERWTHEQLVCPVDRTNIPPLVPQEDL